MQTVEATLKYRRASAAVSETAGVVGTFQLWSRDELWTANCTSLRHHRVTLEVVALAALALL